MPYNDDQDGMRPKVFLTGRDLGVVVCRGLAILLLFVGFGQVVDGLKLQLVFDYWREGGSAASVAIAVVMMFVVVFGMYAVFAGVLWWRADWVADRMLGASGDRVLFSGFSQESAVRVVVVGIGVWFGVSAIMYLVSLLIQLTIKYVTVGSEIGVLAFLGDQDPVDGGAELVRTMLSPSVYLIVSLLCVFGAGPFTRVLMRIKNFGPETSDVTENRDQ